MLLEMHIVAGYEVKSVLEFVKKNKIELEIENAEHRGWTRGREQKN